MSLLLWGLILDWARYLFVEECASTLPQKGEVIHCFRFCHYEGYSRYEQNRGKEKEQLKSERSKQCPKLLIYTTIVVA